MLLIEGLMLPYFIYGCPILYVVVDRPTDPSSTGGCAGYCSALCDPSPTGRRFLLTPSRLNKKRIKKTILGNNMIIINTNLTHFR